MTTPDNSPNFDKGSLMGGRYRLDEALAGGGMAAVWKGHDTILDRAVAVKLLHPHLAKDSTVSERFRREAIAAARLSHPHIVPTFDTGVDGDTAYIVMGLVHGSTLRELLNKGPLPARNVVSIARQVADALDHAHTAGLVHRDIKPTNVLVVDGNNRVMVADFGIAKAVEQSSDPSLTQPGLVIGTPAYAAPEQLSGEEVDGRTDIYATGVLMHEMACGHAVDDLGPTQVALDKTFDAQHSACPDLPEELAPLVAKATAVNPDDRYRTAAEFRDELASLERRLFNAEIAATPKGHNIPQPGQPAKAAGGSTTLFAAQKPKPAPAPTTSGSKRRKRLTIAVAVVLVLLAVAGGLYVRHAGNSNNSDRKAVPTTPGTPVTSIQASSFDPSGDGSEHPGETKNAIDGNPSTAWTTETYNDRKFGTKAGVGLILKLPSSAKLSSMKVSSGSQGWSGQVFVSSSSPKDLAGWGNAVDTQSGLGSTANFDLHGASGTSILLWITDLGDSKRFSASEVTVSNAS